METPHLFTPLQLRGIRLHNRIAVSPMCQYPVLMDTLPTGIGCIWAAVRLAAQGPY